MITVDLSRRQSAAARVEARERFQRAHRVEVQFRRALEAVGVRVGKLVRNFTGENDDRYGLQQALQRYAAQLHPWATAQAARMQSQVDQRDAKAWTELGRTMGRSLRKEIAGAHTGTRMRQLLTEQVDLIKSIPLQAAERIQRLTVKKILESARASEVEKEILRSGQVAAGRAKAIARTEVARTASVLTQSRAEYIGSEGYIWRTSGDSDVRPAHKKLEGKFIQWNAPPISGENGERAHAGQIYNCRCYPEPVIPDNI